MSLVPNALYSILFKNYASLERLWDGVKAGVDGNYKTKLLDLNMDGKGKT
jgi:hypothetical protein